MANGKEETVNRQVVAFLVCLALALHHVYSFNTVLAIQAKGVVLIEYLYLLVLLDTLFHHVRGTEIRLAHYHVHLLAQSGQIGCFLARGVAATNNGNGLLAIEEAVACGACAHALPVVFLLVVESKIFC